MCNAIIDTILSVLCVDKGIVLSNMHVDTPLGTKKPLREITMQEVAYNMMHPLYTEHEPVDEMEFATADSFNYWMQQATFVEEDVLA